MELHQLRYFVAVAKHLHFSKAAEELKVAQPSVSQQIRKLEMELGERLFHRMKRHIALTAAGEALLPRARRILSEVEEARAEIRGLSGLTKGTLSVGCTPSVGTHILPKAMAQFHSAHPGITLTFREAGSLTLIQAIEEGELDLAIVTLPARHPVLLTTPLLEEHLVVAVAPGHRLAGAAGVALEELRHEPFVMFREGYDLREVTLAACRRAGFQPNVVLEGGEMDSVLRFVSAGLGVALVPEMVARDPGITFVAVPLIEPRLVRKLAFARRRDRYLSAAAKEFMSVVAEVVRLEKASEVDRLPDYGYDVSTLLGTLDP